MVGPFRVGKSYFLNKLAGKDELFQTSNGVDPCTKGIWVWVTKHPKRDCNVFVFDTEGLFDPHEQDEHIGNKLFTLMSLLTSSLVLYIEGKIDRNILSALKYPLFEHKFILLEI